MVSPRDSGSVLISVSDFWYVTLHPEKCQIWVNGWGGEVPPQKKEPPIKALLNALREQPFVK